jgi:hypothetical protein
MKQSLLNLHIYIVTACMYLRSMYFIHVLQFNLMTSGHIHEAACLGKAKRKFFEVTLLALQSAGICALLNRNL